MYNELLKVVCESNEPESRLILADWLEEQGDASCFAWRLIAKKGYWPFCKQNLRDAHWADYAAYPYPCVVPGKYCKVKLVGPFESAALAYSALAAVITEVEGDKIHRLLRPSKPTHAVVELNTSSTNRTSFSFDPTCVNYV